MDNQELQTNITGWIMLIGIIVIGSCLFPDGPEEKYAKCLRKCKRENGYSNVQFCMDRCD